MGNRNEAQWQLEQRLGLARREDTARGLFFNGALGLLKQLAGEEIAERCRQASGERKFVDFFSYPVSGFIQLGLTALPLVGERLGGGEAMLRWIGANSTQSFLSTVTGRTMLLLAGGNVKRLINQIPIGYRAAVSYGEREVVWTGETSGRIIFKRDFMPPAYHEGILIEVVKALGVRNVQVRGRAIAPLDSEYELTWESAGPR